MAERDRVGTVIDTEIKDEYHDQLIRRMAHTEACTFIVQGNPGFPFDVFQYPAFRHKRVIAVVQWASELRWPGLWRVLHDSAEGGRLVADHLWELGHRDVLIVDTPWQIGKFSGYTSLVADGPDRFILAHDQFDYPNADGSPRKTILMRKAAVSGG